MTDGREIRLVKKTPVVICIDVEPDEPLIDPRLQEPWSGFETTFQFFSKLRPRLEAATGKPIHFSWFLRMDPQIADVYGTADWVVTNYSSLIEKIRSAGDALGLHIHAWRWKESLATWVVDLDQAWVNQCVRVGFESFRTSLNQTCAYHRFGDLWTSDATLALVEELGAQIDLTPEPGQRGCRADEFFADSFVDTNEMPRRPYRPSKSDFRNPDELHGRKLWIMPMSTGSTDWLPEVFRNGNGSGDSARGTIGTARARLRSTFDSMRGRYEGFLDRSDGEFIAGWAYDNSRPDAAVEVEIYDDQFLLATTPAGIFRPDLLAKGKGNGKCCFNVGVPSCLKDGRAHSIRAKVKGTSFYLNNSPRELKCRAADSPTKYATLNLSFDSWGLCRIIDRILINSEANYLALVVRSDVAARPDQSSNMEQTLEYLLAHPSITELAFETPAEVIANAPLA